MTDAEIFHREMKPYGGCLHVPPDHPGKAGYDSIAKLAEVLISSAMALVPRLPQIRFDFVTNGKTNAWAFKSDGRYFIGLTRGTIFMLELVIMRMLADSRLFDNTGNPKGEADNLVTELACVGSSSTLHTFCIRLSCAALLHTRNPMTRSFRFIRPSDNVFALVSRIYG